MARDDFADHCAELLSGTGAVRRRRMFGGHGLYLDGMFVAIVADERLYLKADATTAPAFESAGGQRFEYEGSGRRVQLQYWTPPDEALDSPALMQPWARRALQAALAAAAGAAKAKAAKPTRRPQRPRTG
jgi:DNA transformation protein